MREIKFRAWDKVSKEIILADDIMRIGVNWHGRFMDFVQSCRGDQMKRWIPNEAILEQYTGLKDKNGKEIYEGDIVILDNLKRFHYPVVWSHDRWFPDKYDNGDYYRPDDVSWSTSKIIGNIHEHPELLGPVIRIDETFKVLDDEPGE